MHSLEPFTFGPSLVLTLQFSDLGNLQLFKGEVPNLLLYNSGSKPQCTGNNKLMLSVHKTLQYLSQTLYCLLFCTTITAGGRRETIDRDLRMPTRRSWHKPSARQENPWCGVDFGSDHLLQCWRSCSITDLCQHKHPSSVRIIWFLLMNPDVINRLHIGRLVGPNAKISSWPTAPDTAGLLLRSCYFVSYLGSVNWGCVCRIFYWAASAAVWEMAGTKIRTCYGQYAFPSLGSSQAVKLFTHELKIWSTASKKRRQRLQFSIVSHTLMSRDASFWS